MKFSISLTILGFLLLNIQSTSAQTNADGLSSANHDLLRDISYSSDAEQNMDIYLSRTLNAETQNITIVFLHGGGDYVNERSKEERHRAPYLEKGFNIVNLNYRLKRGIPVVIEDSTKALHYLKENNSEYNLNLKRILLTGFSARAHSTTNVGVAQNNEQYPNKLSKGGKIIGNINFSGPVDGFHGIENISILNKKIQTLHKSGKS
ncbi:MAG: alpha/beta hydrolase [Cyclobacteriaceae bacterium]